MNQAAKRLFSQKPLPSPVTFRYENQVFCCVFPGNTQGEMMLYEGTVGIYSFEQLDTEPDNSPEAFTHLYRQKAYQLLWAADKLEVIQWLPGQMPEPLGECSYLEPILEELLTQIQSKTNLTIQGKPPYYPYENQLKLHRLKKLPQKPAIWEALQFLAAPKIWDNDVEREFLTMATLITRSSDQELVFQDLVAAKPQNIAKISDKLGDNFLERGYLPKTIRVGDAYLQGILQHFCGQLGIGCEIGEVPTVIAFRNQLIGYKPDLDPMSEAMDYLGVLSRNVYEQMVELHRPFSELERNALKELLPILFVYMGIQHHQLPPKWSPTHIQEMVADKYLEQNVHRQYVPYVYPLLLEFLRFAGKIGLLENSRELAAFVPKK